MRPEHITGRNPVSIVFLSLLFLLTATALPLIAKAKAEDSFHQVIEAAGLEEVALETVNGSIDVTGCDGDQIIFDAALMVEGKKEATCRELLEKIEIDVDKDGEILHIDYESKSKRGYSITVSYTLQVPRQLEIDAETVNGSIDLKGITGEVDLETINGSIDCFDLSGGASAETITGSIEFRNVSGELNAETINGSISCVCKGEAPESADFETINGKISVELHKTPDAHIEAAALNGKIRLYGLSNIELIKKAQTFSSVLGSGKGSYDFSTINGSITIDIRGID